jgi:hypothetical protein
MSGSGSGSGRRKIIGWRESRVRVTLADGSTVKNLPCTVVLDDCEDDCAANEPCDPTCVMDCEAAPDGASRRWQFFTEDTIAGGLTTLDYRDGCEWFGKWKTVLEERDVLLWYDTDTWVLQSPADGSGAIYEADVFSPLWGGQFDLANGNDEGISERFPDTILVNPACPPECAEQPVECVLPESLCVTLADMIVDGESYPGDFTTEMAKVDPPEFGADWMYRSDLIAVGDSNLVVTLRSDAGVVRVVSLMDTGVTAFPVESFACDPFAAAATVRVTAGVPYSYAATFAPGPCPAPGSDCSVNTTLDCDAFNATTNPTIYVTEISSSGTCGLIVGSMLGATTSNPTGNSWRLTDGSLNIVQLVCNDLTAPFWSMSIDFLGGASGIWGANASDVICYTIPGGYAWVGTGVVTGGPCAGQTLTVKFQSVATPNYGCAAAVSNCGGACDVTHELVALNLSQVYTCDAPTWGQGFIYYFTPPTTGTYKIIFNSLHGHGWKFEWFTGGNCSGDLIAEATSDTTGCVEATLTGGVEYWIRRGSAELSDPGTDGYSFHIEAGPC